MTDRTHDNTIDWHQFWTEAEGDRRRSATPGRYGKADLFERFVERRLDGPPRSLAAVGCGPADILFDLAERYPDADFHGYDAAESVVAADRELASAEGVENVAFDVGVLPEFDADQRFDLVYCYATLHYVADVERALRALYDRVTEGGHLVVNYPNRLTRADYERMLAAAERGEDASIDDPEAFRERFALVLDGVNLLSYDRIRNALGTWPRSYWSAVDAPDEPWTGRTNPCVFVPK